MPESEPEFTGAILFCPVCTSVQDAEKWGPQEHTCSNCETVYSVDVDPVKIAAHAIVG